MKTPGILAAVMAVGDRIVGLRGDHESFVDVVKGNVTDRELPDGERDIREGGRGFLAPYQRMSRAADQTVSLWWLEVDGSRHHQGYDWDFGDMGLLALVVMGNIVVRSETFDSGRWSVSRCRYPNTVREISLDEVVVALRACDDEGLDLLAGLSVLGTAFSSMTREQHPPSAFAPDAARLLLAAVCARMKGSTNLANIDPPLSLTPRELVEQLDPSAEVEGWRHAQLALAFVVVGLFGADAAPVLVDWMFLRRSLLVSLEHTSLDRLVRLLVARSPELQPVFVEQGLRF